MRNESAFLKILDEINIAVESGLYNCALALALTIPDICGKVEFPKERSTGKRYRNWFDQYAKDIFTVVVKKLPSNEDGVYPILTSEECYALRCAVLHAGNYRVYKILDKVDFHARIREGEYYSHAVRDSRNADWDVIQICQKLCRAGEQYYRNVEDKTRFDNEVVRIDEW